MKNWLKNNWMFVGIIMLGMVPIVFILCVTSTAQAQQWLNKEITQLKICDILGILFIYACITLGFKKNKNNQ